jgi:hypothetical protein
MGDERCRGTSNSRLFFVLHKQCRDIVLYFGLSAAVLLLYLFLVHGVPLFLLLHLLGHPRGDSV